MVSVVPLLVVVVPRERGHIIGRGNYMSSDSMGVVRLIYENGGV